MSNQLNWSIIKHFSGRNTLGFRFQDVVREFPGKHRVYIARVLADMVEKGMLHKIARNLYHIIPMDADTESYKPDSLQVAKYIMENKEYYIAYASALKIHGRSFLSDTETSKNKVYVVTAKQMNPGILNIGKTTFHFIQHSPTRFFGFESTWISHLEKAMVSDLEKTIVDIATKPQYGGGIVELGKALFRGNKYINYNNLFYCLSGNKNKSAKKRILFLTELLGLKWSEMHDLMLTEIGSGISILDPSVPDQGRNRSDFGLKINVDPSRLKLEIYS